MTAFFSASFSFMEILPALRSCSAFGFSLFRTSSLFLLVYAISMLFVGKFMDTVGVKKGYVWAIAIWSFGSILHAFCGIATCGALTGEWMVGFNDAKETLHDFGIAGLPITTMSI